MTAGLELAPARVEAGSPSSRRARRWRRPPSPVAAFWVVTLATLVLTLARNSYIFTRHIYEDGDFALNSILVNHTHNSVQLVGNYSRVGFDHPGPAYIYVLSAGQTLFHDLLHIVPSQYGGQLLGDVILQSVLIGLVVFTIYRATQSVIALLLTASIVFFYSATHSMLGYPWLPFMYMTAFAVLIAAGTALAAGSTRDLVLVVFAGCLLIHGHVAFIGFVAVTLVPIVGGWLNHHRSRWRKALRESRRSLRSSLIVIAVFAAPMVAEIVLHYPGPWGDYYRYATDHAQKPHTAAESVAFLGHFWSASVPVWLALAAAGVAALSLLADRSERRRGYFLWGYLILAVETLMIFYYISRGVDTLVPVNYYVGFFYETVPMFLLVFAAIHAVMLVHDRLGRPPNDVLRRATPGLACAAAVLLVVAGALSPTMANPYRGSDSYPKIVTALTRDPDRAGRPIVLDVTQDTWGAAAGVIIEADRSGLSACLQDPYWQLLFTATSMCSTTNRHWPVAIVPRSTWHGQGKIIWSDADNVVYEGQTPNLPPR